MWSELIEVLALVHETCVSSKARAGEGTRNESSVRGCWPRAGGRGGEDGDDGVSVARGARGTGGVAGWVMLIARPRSGAGFTGRVDFIVNGRCTVAGLRRLVELG